MYTHLVQVEPNFFYKFRMFIGAITFLGLLPLLFFLPNTIQIPNSLFEQDNWGSSMQGNTPIASVQSKLDTNSIPFWFQFTDFDPVTGYLSANTYIWPSQDLAEEFSSSTKISVPIKVFIDNMFSPQLYSFKSGQAIGAIPIVLDSSNPKNLSTSSEFFFPFDKYSIDSYIKIEQGNTASGNSFSPANTYELFWQPQISGFTFDIWRGSTFKDTYDWFSAEAYDKEKVFMQRQNGEISLLIEVSRSTAVKLSAILLYLGILLGSLALFFTSIYVAQAKRPSSLTALVWSATSVLGAIQLRDLIPGHPGAGILLDFCFFYPAILMSILSTLLLSFYWVKYETYAI